MFVGGHRLEIGRSLGFTARGLQAAHVSLAKQVILGIAAAD